MYSLVWVLIYRHSKPIKFGLSKWILVVNILTQSFITLLNFIALQVLQKMLIFGGRFLFGVSYYVIFQFTPRRVINGNNMVSKIWVIISTTNVHLLQFKIESNLQKRRLWMPVHQNLLRRKGQPLLTLQLPFCIFLSKWNLLFLIKPPDTLQNGSF